MKQICMKRIIKTMENIKHNLERMRSVGHRVGMALFLWVMDESLYSSGLKKIHALLSTDLVYGNQLQHTPGAGNNGRVF